MANYSGKDTKIDPPPVHAATIVEQRSGGGLVILAIIALALILAIGYFLIQKPNPRNSQANAVAAAAESVGDSATRAGDAVAKTAEKLDRRP